MTTHAPEAAATASYAERLLARLKELIDEYSLSEVGRRTNTLPSTVWKYARGTKIPLEFGVALVSGFGLNPSWLVSGDRSKYLSDITADTEATAANVLELVQAMTAVAHKKLGALLGKDHLVRLRELDEAINVYDDIRAQLNQRFGHFLKKLLEDFEKALDDLDFERAKTIRAALHQVMRFCDDAEASDKAEELEALLEHDLGNMDRSLEMERKIFFRRFLASPELTEVSVKAAESFLTTLYFCSHAREALRIGRAVLRYYEKVGAQWYSYQFIQITVAALEINTGELQAGAQRLNALLFSSGLHDEIRERGWLSGAQIRAGFFSGTQSFDALKGARNPTDFTRFELCKIAMWSEDVKAIQWTLDQEWGSGRDMSKDPMLVFGRCLLQARRGQANEAATQMRKHFDRGNDAGAPLPTVVGAMNGFIRDMALAHFSYHCGRLDEARRHTLKADALLNAIPRRVTPDLIWRGIHYRNALRLIPANSRAKEQRTMRARARAFFDDHAAKGYHCFVGVIAAVEAPVHKT